MHIDQRSPYQRAQADKRCPTCGHRPQDEIDKALGTTLGGSSVGVQTCPDCLGSGFMAPTGDTASRACSGCGGTGRIVR